MKRIALLAALWAVFVCANYANAVDIEGTIWEYQLSNIELENALHYGFSGGNVYGIANDNIYKIPNRSDIYASYTNDFAIMYMSYGNIMWTYIISDFEREKATQISMAYSILFILDWDIKQTGFMDEIE